MNIYCERLNKPLPEVCLDGYTDCRVEFTNISPISSKLLHYNKNNENIQ